MRPAHVALPVVLLSALAGLVLALRSGSPPGPPIVALAPSSEQAARRLPPSAEASAVASAVASVEEAPRLPPCEPSVAGARVHRGDVVLCAPGQNWEQLTHHGKATSVALSPSGKLALYVRSEGVEKVSLGSGDGVEIPDMRYAQIDLARRSEREVARNDPDKSGCMSLWGITFVDDAYALVHADGYGVPNVHNHSVCGVDLARGKLVMLGRRSTCAVPLTAGRYRGMVWVTGFDFKVGQGLSDWQGVVDRQGRRVRAFDPDPFVIDRNHDGNLEDSERDGLCANPLPDPAAMEAIQRKL